MSAFLIQAVVFNHSFLNHITDFFTSGIFLHSKVKSLGVGEWTTEVTGHEHF